MSYRPITITCPICEDHDIDGMVAYDPGEWRDASGHGSPEQWDIDFRSTMCPAYVETRQANTRIEAAFIRAAQDVSDA